MQRAARTFHLVTGEVLEGRVVGADRYNLLIRCEDGRMVWLCKHALAYAALEIPGARQGPQTVGPQGDQAAPAQDNHP
jgi:sRNA-binding regulator protein Hfq